MKRPTVPRAGTAERPRVGRGRRRDSAAIPADLG
jgi:hypothetical protein